MELYQFTYMQTYYFIVCRSVQSSLLFNSAFIIQMIILKLDLYTSFLSSIPMTMTKLFMREI